jgi:hypothetical protein
VIPSYYRTPEALVEELGLLEPEDIDVEAIAQYCGATIVYEPLTGCAARLIGYKDRAIITVDRRATRPRQRFSAMHELGHWMLDRGKACVICTEQMFGSYTGEAESRSNRYAGNILLPSEMFSSRAEKLEMTFGTVRRLAEAFQTSLTSTAFRLVELGSFPAMLVCSAKGWRRWFHRGPRVPEDLWPCDQPGQESVAFKLHAGAQAADRPADVGAENWVTHPRSRLYMVREHSVRIMDGIVLSLIWWKDQEQLVDWAY